MANNIEKSLLGIGLNPKEVSAYLSLLALGPSAIRKVADYAGINRGSAYDALKELQKRGLVSYYHKEKRQHFVAEDPATLGNLLRRKQQEIETINKNLTEIIPELQTLANPKGSRPAVKYYENYSGIRSILEDALSSTSKMPIKEYVAYSSSAIRPYLYDDRAFPDFTDERIKRKISVRVIAIGSGGEIYGKDERKWLSKTESAPTYTLIYAGKMAMISVGKNKLPHGLIIEDEGIYKTQMLIFNSLWDTLNKK